MIKATGEFVALFKNVADPVLSVACKQPTLQGKIAWVLLGSALYQQRTYIEIKKLLENLSQEFPDDKLWALPVPGGSRISKVIQKTFTHNHWSLTKETPGIFWSVGLFVRHHDDLEGWVKSRTPEEIWRDLGEIYYMGKSASRPKACAAIYRLIAVSPLGLGLNHQKGMLPSLPLTMGARRFLAILGPAKDTGFASLSPVDKQKMATDFYKKVMPENPYEVAHALQFFLEEGVSDFMCREHTSCCKTCPLYIHCSYGGHCR